MNFNELKAELRARPHKVGQVIEIYHGKGKDALFLGAFVPTCQPDDYTFRTLTIDGKRREWGIGFLPNPKKNASVFKELAKDFLKKAGYNKVAVYKKRKKEFIGV